MGILLAPPYSPLATLGEAGDDVATTLVVTAPSRFVKGELLTREPVDMVLNELLSRRRTPIAPAPPSAPATTGVPRPSWDARLDRMGLAVAASVGDVDQVERDETLGERPEEGGAGERREEGEDGVGTVEAVLSNMLAVEVVAIGSVARRDCLLLSRRQRSERGNKTLV